MTEYIERESIVLTYEFGMVSDDGIVCIPIRDVKKSIANTPTVDVVKVIRCKKCRHYNTSCCGNGLGWCEYYNTGATDEHFCSHGEKRV